MAQGSATIPEGTERALPTGTVTFLFSDIEGSTRLVEELGANRYGDVLEMHRDLLRAAFGDHGGIEVGTEGDSFFMVFPDATEALIAASDAQRALASATWPHQVDEVRVRMGLHTGEGTVVAGTYVGVAVNRAARIAAAAHGGQVVLSAATRGQAESHLPAAVRLRDMGEHHLKDLAEPERIAQLLIADLPAEFPPLRTLEAVPNNLPVQLTSFVGRSEDIDAVADLLRTARLVTLTGPGGTGKTRLSLQVAADIADRFADGVWFVPLAPISDPALVASAIATAIGLQVAGAGSIRDALVNHLREEETLLVLDNVEQVVEAAPLVADLLREAPRLRVLATSRIVLRISGEHELPVDALSDAEAARLFVERSRAVRPDFEITDENRQAVAEILARLDRLPLAIELAAARSRLLTPAAMLARLDHRLDLLAADLRDLPARQRTIRGAIDWSYDLLDDELRRVFSRMAVFVGGGRLEDIEAIIGAPGSAAMDVMSGLEALVEHSLVRHVESTAGSRFWMLATIHDYAIERLAEGGDERSIRDRHASLFLALAEEVAPELLGPEQPGRLARLDAERDNLRAAIGHAVGVADTPRALRLCAALWRYWQMRGLLYEGIERTREALALPDAADHPAERLAALDAAGGLTWWLGDYPACADYYRQVLDGRLVEGEERAIAQAYYNVAFPAMFSDDSEAGINYVSEARRRFEALGDADAVARARWGLAMQLLILDDIDAAKVEVTAATEHFRSADLPFDLTWGLFVQGSIAQRRGELDEAERAWDEALRMRHGVGDVAGVAMLLDPLASIAAHRGDLDRAARLSGVVARLERITGAGLNERNRQLRGDFAPETMRDDLATRAAWREGEALSIDEAVAYALEGSPP